MKDDLKISLKKPSYPVNTALAAFLQKFNRTVQQSSRRLSRIQGILNRSGANNK